MLGTTVDDANSAIVYSGGWSLNHTADSSDFNHTTTTSTSAGAGFVFQFNGTAVSVYGCLEPHMPSSATYTLDDGAPTRFTSADSDAYVPQRVFFDSGAVPLGAHTLRATAAGPGLCIDYVQYAPSPSSAVPTAVAPSMPARARTELRVLLPAVLLPCAAVVVAVLAFVVFVKRRRRRRAQDVVPEDLPYTPSTPYVPPATGSSASGKIPEKALLSDRPPEASSATPCYEEAPPTYTAR
ncbi:hypothetical protein PsYK624_115400 [Phanerochaete sordida]|uniref:Uncharacterized protein n=1 Tax=Phanerochaete sordida TaxID=48140 RepID=A0A9P3GIF3_9APHY|nr:hypothetical protein PsYK624_115400 [Phanerochaete sordida]